MSVIVGFKGANIIKSDIHKLKCLLCEYCMAGVIALKRGDIENTLHFQMVCRACIKSVISFGVIVQKYMGWYDNKDTDPKGRIFCKVLIN